MYSQPLRGIGDSSVASADSASYAEAYSVLQHKSRAELDKLMNDNDEFDSLINGLAMVKKLGTDKEALMVSNVSLAEYNISLEPRLISSREDLAEQYNRLVELQKQCERAMLRFETSSVHTSSETTLALLQTELAKTEEQSEKIAEDFSASGRSGDVDSFITQYVNLRTLTHIRRVKVDKLTETLNSNQRVSAVSTVPTSALPPPVPNRPAPQPYLSGPPVVAPSWNNVPPYPMPGATNGWQPYPQTYNAMNAPYQPGPPIASYMHR